MRAALIAAFAISFATYALAVRWLFVSPARMPNRMRALSVAGIGAAVVHVISLAMAPLSSPTAPLALVCYALGLSLFLWAAATMRAQPLPIAFSTLTPAKISAEGPYRLFRHPCYLSYSLTWVAGAIATRSLIVAVTVCVMIAFYVSAVRREERQLLAGPLGDDYRRYRQQTSAFVPRLFRRSPRASIR